MTVTYGDFARSICSGLGCPANDSLQLDALVTVMVVEASGADFNPMDTTQVVEGSTAYNDNDPPVQSYPSFAAGVEATVETLTNGDYAGIVAMLKAGDQAAKVLASREWQIWTGQADISTLYAETLEAVEADRERYYGLAVAGSGDADPTPAPAPEPKGAPGVFVFKDPQSDGYFTGPYAVKIPCEDDLAELLGAGFPKVTVSQAFFDNLVPKPQAPDPVDEVQAEVSDSQNEPSAAGAEEAANDPPSQETADEDPTEEEAHS